MVIKADDKNISLSQVKDYQCKKISLLDSLYGTFPQTSLEAINERYESVKLELLDTCNHEGHVDIDYDLLPSIRNVSSVTIDRFDVKKLPIFIGLINQNPNIDHITLKKDKLHSNEFNMLISAMQVCTKKIGLKVERIKLEVNNETNEEANVSHFMYSLIGFKNLYKLHLKQILHEDEWVEKVIKHEGITSLSLPAYSYSPGYDDQYLKMVMLKPNLRSFTLNIINLSMMEQIRSALSDPECKIEKLTTTEIKDLSSCLNHNIHKIVVLYFHPYNGSEIYPFTYYPGIYDEIRHMLELEVYHETFVNELLLIAKKLEENHILRYRREAPLAKLCSDFIYKEVDKEKISELRLSIDILNHYNQ